MPNNNKNPPTRSVRRSRAIEERYYRSLHKLYKAIYKQMKGVSSLVEVHRRLAVIQSTAIFRNFARSMAVNMATLVNRLSDSDWRLRAEEANNSLSRDIFKALSGELDKSKGRRRRYLRRIILDMIDDNAQMIVTLPDQIANDIAVYMAKEHALGGVRHEQLTKEIFARYFDTGDPEVNQFIEYKARRIARTEISKAQCALTLARMDDLELKWYVWKSAEDGDRVRSAHQFMHGVLVNRNDPPDPERLDPKTPNRYSSKFGPYHAGNIYNCRCYPEPVIDIDWLDWSQKQRVHLGGQIQKMTKQEFRQWVNI